MDGTIRARVAGHRATRLLRDVLAVAAIATLGWLLMALLNTASAAADSGPEEPGSQGSGSLGGLIGGLVHSVGSLTGGASGLVDPVVDALPAAQPDRTVPAVPAPRTTHPVEAAPAVKAASSGRPNVTDQSVTGQQPVTGHRRPAVIAAAASATVPTGTVVSSSPRVDRADRPGGQRPGAIPAGPSAPVAPAGGVTCGPDAPGGFVVLSGPDRPEPSAGSAPIGHDRSVTGRHAGSLVPTPD
jgi:hypothetical protein